MNTALKAPVDTTASAKAKAETQPTTTPTSEGDCQQTPRQAGMNRWVPREVVGGTASARRSLTPPAPRQPVTLTGEKVDRLHNMTLGLGLLIRNAAGRALTTEERTAAEKEICWALDLFNPTTRRNKATTAQE